MVTAAVVFVVFRPLSLPALVSPCSRLFEVDGDAAVSPRPHQAPLYIKGLLVLWLSLC